jgi:acetoacetate decarboxylase
VVGARHVIANLTLDVGEVALDYLASSDSTGAQPIRKPVVEESEYVVAK